MNVDQTISDLSTLPIDDRLRVVHAIWDTLPDDVDLKPTPGQQAELDRRLAAHRSDSHSGLRSGCQLLRESGKLRLFVNPAK